MPSRSNTLQTIALKTPGLEGHQPRTTSPQRRGGAGPTEPPVRAPAPAASSLGGVTGRGRGQLLPARGRGNRRKRPLAASVALCVRGKGRGCEERPLCPADLSALEGEGRAGRRRSLLLQDGGAEEESAAECEWRRSPPPSPLAHPLRCVRGGTRASSSPSCPGRGSCPP